MKKFIFIFLLHLPVYAVLAQQIQILHEQPKTSFRGLSVVNDKVVWVSGNNGTIGRSTDAGTNWKWIKVKNYETIDFRDIEAFDSLNAVIMGIASPAYILRTADGGITWNKVYQNDHPEIFLDAMEFWNDQSGIVIGDPINGRFFIARTFDGGKSWQTLPEQNLPLADSAEACFASSGTNIRKLKKDEAVFITGGLSAHIFIRDKKIKLPIMQGSSSTGANSIAVKDHKTMIVVGGDFNSKEDTTRNCIITNDGGNTWTFPAVSPKGYRSCVEYLSKNKWITCGLNGIDLSLDDGKNWKAISSESFHVVRKAKKGKTVYFAGNNGKIAKLVRD